MSALNTLTRLMAPVVPFITDYVWGVLRTTDAPESVHLASWPVADQGLIDERLSGQMAPGPAAGRAGPVGPVGRVGPDPPAAPPRAGGRSRGSRTCHRN